MARTGSTLHIWQCCLVPSFLNLCHLDNADLFIKSEVSYGSPLREGTQNMQSLYVVVFRLGHTLLEQ